MMQGELRAQSARLMNDMLKRVHLWSSAFVIVEREGDHIDVEQIKKANDYTFHFIKRKARKWNRFDTVINWWNRFVGYPLIEVFEHEGGRWRVFSENRVVIKGHLVDTNLFHNKSSEWRNEAAYAADLATSRNLLQKLVRHEHWK